MKENTLKKEKIVSKMVSENKFGAMYPLAMVRVGTLEPFDMRMSST